MKSLLLLSLPLALADGSQKPIGDAWALPRGVNPALADKYRPTSQSTFTCLSSSHQIPISLLNDDFCDCPDGTDEPGTSACSHLSSKVNPLPGFYCENKGHVPAYIPFNRINDGICDYDTCCDGSDEWMGVGGVVCPDRCDEIGKEARKAAAEAKKAWESGVRAYSKLVEKAVLLKKEVEDKIVTLEGEVRRSERLVEDKRLELQDAEEEEKLRIAKSGGGKSRHAQLLEFAKEKVVEYQENLRKVYNEREALKTELESVEKILETFKKEYNPNFNDEGVKRAVKAWEDYLAGKTQPATPEGSEVDAEADMNLLMYDEVDWHNYEPEQNLVLEDMYAIESLLPPFLRSWVHEQLNTLRDSLVEYGLLAARKTPAASTGTTTSPHIQKLTDALSSAETSLNNQKSELSGLQEDLTRDYGRQEVFRALKDSCTEAQSGEYTYSFCHLGRATQKNRDGGSTHLGDWTGFELRFDDEVEKDVVVIKYERGARCWNGPERSAYIYLRCSAEEKVLSVAETEKCVYKYVATSPAVCGEEILDAEEGVKMGEAVRVENPAS